MNKPLIVVALAALSSLCLAQATWLKNYKDQDSKLGWNTPITRPAPLRVGAFLGADTKVFSQVFNYGVSGKPFDKAYFGPTVSLKLCPHADFVVGYTGYVTKLELPKNNQWGLGFSVRF